MSFQTNGRGFKLKNLEPFCSKNCKLFFFFPKHRTIFFKHLDTVFLKNGSKMWFPFWKKPIYYEWSMFIVILTWQSKICYTEKHWCILYHSKLIYKLYCFLLTFIIFKILLIDFLFFRIQRWKDHRPLLEGSERLPEIQGLPLTVPVVLKNQKYRYLALFVKNLLGKIQYTVAKPAFWHMLRE